jgi:uncharacterized membrane protein HdeD (DUF308 family)
MATERSPVWMGRVTWVLIFGGLLTLVLGLSALKQDAATGIALIVVGGVLALIGAALVWVRSRMDGPP